MIQATMLQATISTSRMSRPHRMNMRTTPHIDSGPHLAPGQRLLEARAYDATIDGQSWDEPSTVGSYDAMVTVATECCADGLLWCDDAFPRTGVPSGTRWLPLSELFGRAPHKWPDGRSSHLYAYSHHASEIAGAAPPGSVLQGALADCHLLSAVAAVFASSCGVEARCELIDESLEPAGIYGVSFFVRGRWRMVWVDSYFPCERLTPAACDGAHGEGDKPSAGDDAHGEHEATRLEAVQEEGGAGEVHAHHHHGHRNHGHHGSHRALGHYHPGHAPRPGGYADEHASHGHGGRSGHGHHRPSASYGGRGLCAEGWVPLFAHSTGQYEAWLMVVEKAYAKLNGGYGALEGGTVDAALSLLTGGIAATSKLPGANSRATAVAAECDGAHADAEGADGDARGGGSTVAGTTAAACRSAAPQRRRRRSHVEALVSLVSGEAGLAVSVAEAARRREQQARWDQLSRAVAEGFVAVGTLLDTADGGPPEVGRRQQPSGVVLEGAHAFSVLAVSDEGRRRRVLLRNPWGVMRYASSGHDRGEVDGEMWMDHDEFEQRFALLYRCKVLRTTLRGGPWHMTVLQNEWRGVSAAGCPNCGPSYWSNPAVCLRPLRPTQIVAVLLQLPPLPLAAEAVDVPSGCGSTTAAAAPSSQAFAIGLIAFGVRHADAFRQPGRPAAHPQMLAASSYVRASQVVLELPKVHSGGSSCVCLIPSTFRAAEEGRFCLYLYCSEPVEIHARASEGWAAFGDSHHAGGRLLTRRGAPGSRPLAVAAPPPVLAHSTSERRAERLAADVRALREAAQPRNVPSGDAQTGSALKFQRSTSVPEESLGLRWAEPSTSHRPPRLSTIAAELSSTSSATETSHCSHASCCAFASDEPSDGSLASSSSHRSTVGMLCEPPATFKPRLMSVESRDDGDSGLDDRFPSPGRPAMRKAVSDASAWESESQFAG